MRDQEKTKLQLIVELEMMRKRITDFEDLEHRRNAEVELLLETEKRLDESLPTRPAGKWTWNVSSGEVVFRYGFEISEEECRYRGTWEEIVCPDDVDVVMSHLESFRKRPIRDKPTLDVPHANNHFRFRTREQRLVKVVCSRIHTDIVDRSCITIHGHYADYGPIVDLELTSLEPVNEALSCGERSLYGVLIAKYRELMIRKQTLEIQSRKMDQVLDAADKDSQDRTKIAGKKAE